ncbi:UNVERIFIED_ORG: putative secreted Zn-dependent protease [Rhizobium sophorae]|nr:putative secreted Zn-dependent protease [Rhizobium leguminosarum]MBB4520974.1 putative secreted Zn-dependent protease [Rhizobium leguminosarum]MDH6270468.1 putative secreted Zn-dependent protease [Rhizobium leguminosarum]MDH6657411.1 putative secreted Zn-dependent protease [Rhizobium sophorae]
MTTTNFLSCVLAAVFTSVPAMALAEWQAVEEVRPYSISGKTGAELYESIGARGPEAGAGRVIAHTTFKLTWTRKYEPQGNACVITTNRPKLIITYTLPKPAAELPAAVKSSWQAFISGVQAHERVHGETIKEMVKEIEATSIGLTVADDPDCKKIRIELTRRLGEISGRQRQRGRDFDKIEMGDGGNIQQLILKLVNGP